MASIAEDAPVQLNSDESSLTRLSRTLGRWSTTRTFSRDVASSTNAFKSTICEPFIVGCSVLAKLIRNSQKIGKGPITSSSSHSVISPLPLLPCRVYCNGRAAPFHWVRHQNTQQLTGDLFKPKGEDRSWMRLLTGEFWASEEDFP